MLFPVLDSIELFKRRLSDLRERVGTETRSSFEEDLQKLSNQRFDLVRDFSDERRRIEGIVLEHQTLAPQLRLRTLTGRHSPTSRRADR